MACGRGQTSNAASSVEEQKDQEHINVMFLCDEWKSSKGGLSTFNREFAVNLAKTATDSIKVHCYVSQSDELSKQDARQHGVNIITARSIPGSTDQIDWLKIPPPELPNPDIVIGHGRKFGTPAYFIVQTAKCKWVHFVHVFCEDLGKYKVTQSASVDTIEENEKKHKSEIELCKAADLVVAVGSRLQEKYSRSLLNVKVEIITPGIIEKFSNESSQLVKDRSVVKKFNVFMFGRANFEDLTLKGYDIIANAIGSLDKMFELTFVGSSSGEHRKIEQWFLDNTSISRNQITIRSYCSEQDELKMMFHESDMVALPSRTEGFGLVALEAISAGIPVLVAGESGIAEALQEVEGGKSVVVESDDASEWARRIQQLSNQSPEERQNSAKMLRENYNKVNCWSNECEKFKRMFQELVESVNQNALKISINVETMKPAEHTTQDRTPPDDKHQEASATPMLSEDTQPLSSGGEALQTLNVIPTAEELFRSIVSNFWQTTQPSSMDEHYNFLAYAKEMRLVITGVNVGSLVITVKCDSLQILEALWKDYSSGHLGKVVQRCFVTEEILGEFSLAELKLKTTILEEEYKAYKLYFEKNSARVQPEEKQGLINDEQILTETCDENDFPTETEEDDLVPDAEDHCESVALQRDKSTNFTKENISTKTDDEDGFVSDDKGQLESAAVLGKKPTHFTKEKILTQRDEDKDDSGFSSSSSSRASSTSKVSQKPGQEIWRQKMQHIIRVGLEMFDVSLPEGLQDYVTYLTNKMYSTAGQESLSVRNFTKVMGDYELKQFVSIHVKEDTWQVVVWVLDELLRHHGAKPAAEREVREADEDAKSDKSKSRPLTWWPTDMDQDLVTLCKVMTEGDCRLNSLDLSQSDPTNKGIRHLAEALTHRNCVLNSLNLSHGEITDKGVKHLAEALTHDNCKLNSLDLSWNDTLTDEGVKHLAEALTHSNCKLHSLNLSGNDAITDKGLKHLVEALTHENCKLNSLYLRCNDQITDKGVKHLAVALRHGTCKLNCLQISDNCAITDEGIKHLAEALMHSNCKLYSVNLSWNKNITDAGVKHLAEAITHSNCKLNSIDLSLNENITDQGVEYFAEALTYNSCKLNSLSLRCNGKITDGGVKHLAEALTHDDCKLNCLDLSGNYQLTDEGLKHLAEALVHSNYELRSRNRADIIVTAKVKEHVSEEGLG
ncbi:uncharacterized protein LOC144632796 isoform X3 [Oculina patagonica]